MPQTVEEEQRVVFAPGGVGSPEVAQHADAVGAELEDLVRDLERAFQERLARREAELVKQIAELEAMLAETEPRIQQLGRQISALQAQRSPAKESAPRKPGMRQSDARRINSLPRQLVIGGARLPLELTVCSLERLVAECGFEVKNHRAKNGRGGGLWVFCSEDALRPLVDQLGKRGVRCRYHQEGKRRRDPRAAWELDTTKLLEFGR